MKPKMKGTIVSLAPNMGRKIIRCDAPATLEQLREAIGGGYLEMVPLFDTFEFEDHSVHKCVVFCDEEGKLKELPVNRPATFLWLEALERNDRDPLDDVLVGTIAIVFGDQEFMDAL